MEIEFKFGIPANRLHALEAAMADGATTTTRLQARYFDTADGCLAAHGVALRLRHEGSQWVQTAKAVVVGQGPLHRLEHNAPLDQGAVPESDVALLAPDIGRHAGTPVGQLLDRLLDHGRTPLVQTMATDIVRRAQHETLNGTTVELALDVGQVSGGPADGAQPRVSPVCELELELVEGSVEDLVALAQAWSARHGLWLSTVSKSERGQRLAQPADKSLAVKATPPHFGKKGFGTLSGAAIQRAVLTACLAQVLPNASEVASGNEETEVVHQLRVGIRRLRTALRELDGLTPSSPFDPIWQETLTHVFRVLGTQRDAELLQAGLQPQLRAADAPEVDIVQVKKGGAGQSLERAVRAPAFQAVLVALIGFTVGGGAEGDADEGADEGDGGPRKLFVKRLRKLHRQVLRDGARFESLPEETQHRVRKRLKRLRYLAEFVGPLFGSKQTARYATQLEPAQDALGRFNDTVVALRSYREAVGRDPQAWFAVGWLSAQLPAMARDCRKALGRLERVERFWKER